MTRINRYALDVLPLQSSVDEAELRQVLIDANDPSRFITARVARSAVRKLIAGLRSEGFEPGDCLCLHSFNDVRNLWSLDGGQNGQAS